jgi:hypothetical protein
MLKEQTLHDSTLGGKKGTHVIGDVQLVLRLADSSLALQIPVICASYNALHGKRTLSAENYQTASLQLIAKGKPAKHCLGH